MNNAHLMQPINTFTYLNRIVNETC
jgi:hypothetical protein